MFNYRLWKKVRSVVYFIRRTSNVTFSTTKITTKQIGLNISFKQFSTSCNMLNNVKEYQLWNPTDILCNSPNKVHAMIVLNRPIKCEQEFVRNMWKTARVTVTVDGGTDRWLTFLGSDKDEVLCGNCAECLPNIITGDMDSISKETLKTIESLGVKVIHTMDQNMTDYTKSLSELELYIRENDIKLNVAYVLAETSGRLDQIIAGISTLYKSQNILHNVPVIQIASNSLTWLLQPGMHKIMIPDALRNSESWCSLLPVGYPAKNVSTSGLKWNLDNHCLEMNGLVSSSNTYSDQPFVTVSTDTPIVWSMAIKPIIHDIKR